MDTELKEIIQHIYPLPEDCYNELESHFQCFEYPENFYLLKSGKVCQHLWFMKSGVIRHFYTSSQGKEMNTWFSIDKQIITDTVSFAHQQPSLESIQLLEDSVIYSIHYSSIQSMLEKYHAFALWYIKLIENHYVAQIEDRVGELQFLDARQRYEKLLSMYPQITNRISLGHISSYLNITQETLSRIRSGKV